MKSISIVLLAILFLVNRSDSQITSSASGNWSAGATWVGGVVPAAGNDVIIAASQTVTIDIASAECNALTINGNLTFPDATGMQITIYGNCLIGATGFFNVYQSGSPTAIRTHTIVFYRDLTVTSGGRIDMRRGSGTTVAVGRVIFSGNTNSSISLSQTTYGSSIEEFNSVVINKTGGAKVILATGTLFQNNNSTTAGDTLVFISGMIETGSNMWVHLATSSAAVSGASSTSYVNGILGRGMSNSAGSNRRIDIGDSAGYRPITVQSITSGAATGHYVWAKVIGGNANTGSSAFTGGIDKVSEIRYYQVGYTSGAGAASMSFARFSPSYRNDDGVNPGNTDLRTAYSIDGRATWNGNGPSSDTTNLSVIPKTLVSDSLTTAVVRNGGDVLYVALARATGTTTNPLNSIPLTPTFTMNVTSVDFTPLFLGTTRKDSVTVTNDGSDTLRILGIISTSPRFTLTDTAGVIAPAGSKTFVITFAGTDTLLVTAKIIFTHNAAQGKDTLSVQGKASLTPQAVLSFNKSQISFGLLAVGASKKDSVLVSNTGTDTLKITSVVSTRGIFVPGFTSATILPEVGKYCVITVTLDSAKQRTAYVVFTSNGKKGIDSLKVTVDPSTGIVDIEGVPLRYGLEQNYPNPFNPTTSISFSVPTDQLVTLTIYDLLGRQVDVLTNSLAHGGTHTVVWNAEGQASGFYLYRIQAKNFIAVRRMVLIK
jgi:G8 domain/Secretion system C-terminal sorting domain/Abnormal spindle-like microcephaly-assoc'd, ASPM-SPD-2-Hydin